MLEDTQIDGNPTVSIVKIPVEFFAHIEDGKVRQFVVLPLESYAGYFGPKSSVYDGPELDEEGIWKPIQKALAPRPRHLYGNRNRHLAGRIEVEWQE